MNIASDQLTCKNNNNQSGRSQWAESNLKKNCLQMKKQRRHGHCCVSQSADDNKRAERINLKKKKENPKKWPKIKNRWDFSLKGHHSLPTI